MSPREEPSKVTEQTPGLLSTGKSALVFYIMHHVFNIKSLEDLNASFEFTLSLFVCLCNPYVLTEVTIISLHLQNCETRIFQPKVIVVIAAREQ